MISKFVVSDTDGADAPERWWSSCNQVILLFRIGILWNGVLRAVRPNKEFIDRTCVSRQCSLVKEVSAFPFDQTTALLPVNFDLWIFFVTSPPVYLVSQDLNHA